MDLEGIMLSEINQTEKDKYSMISPNSQKYRVEWWWGKWEDVGQIVHISSYKMNKF